MRRLRLRDHAALVTEPTKGRTGRLVGILALTETVSFGVLLYAFSVLIIPMEQELGTTRGALSAALAAAAVSRALTAPVVGGWIDRRGVRWLMTTGSLAGTALVWAWSEVTSVQGLLLVFVGIGVVGAMVFYEPAFAAVARAFDGRAQARATLAITVAAGFASTIFFPTTALLEQSLGWRGALKALALVLLALTVVPNLLLLRDRPGRIDDPEPGATLGRPPSMALWTALRSRDFRLLALVLIGGGLPIAMFAAHLPALIQERGETAIVASSIAGGLGILSVTGRVLLTAALRLAPLPRLLMLVFLVQAAGTSLLLAGGPGRGTLIGFVLLFGLGYGTLSIAAPLLISQRFGRRSFGAIAGSLEALTGLLGAVAPVTAGVLRDTAGDYRPVMVLALVSSLLASLTARRLAATRSDTTPMTSPHVDPTGAADRREP